MDITPKSMTSRKTTALPLKILVSVLMIGMLATRMKAGSLTMAVRHPHFSALFVALALMVGQIFFLAVRWQLLVNADARRLTLADSLRITVSGLLANALLITSLGGSIVRVGLTVRQGMNLVKCICAAVADRFLTLAAIIGLAGLALPLLPAGMTLGGHRGLLAAVAVAGFGLALVGYALFGDALRRLVVTNRKIAAAAIYLRRIMADRRRLFLICAVSLIGQLLYFAAVYAVTAPLPDSVSFIRLMQVLPVITLVSSLPLGAGGWGVRESAFVYGLGFVGVPAESAFIVSVQIGIVSMTSIILAGLPALLDSRVTTMFKEARARDAA
jgi:glycosyltransferase 2 family protein